MTKKPRAMIERTVDGHTIRFDSETSRRMGDVRQRDTKPELLVRRALAAHGLRFRTRNRDLAGSPDVANRSGRWAVFVHGCYWHRHPGCSRATTPKRNAPFWMAKFDANVARDARARAALAADGFAVLTIWECDAENTERLGEIISAFAAAIAHAVSAAPRRVARASKRTRSSSGSQSSVS